MKKYNLYAILIAAASLTSGCEKYLDHEPDNRTQITTPDQLSQLLTSAYPKANYILFCESMSDNAEDKNGAGTGYDFIDRINRQGYRYEVIESAPGWKRRPCPVFCLLPGSRCVNRGILVLRVFPIAALQSPFPERRGGITRLLQHGAQRVRVGQRLVELVVAHVGVPLVKA